MLFREQSWQNRRDQKALEKAVKLAEQLLIGGARTRYVAAKEWVPKSKSVDI